MEISKTKISLIAGLQTRKMRQRHHLFVAEGEKCVLDTLGAFHLEHLVATPEWLADHPLQIDDMDAVLEASPAVMRKISSLSNAPEVLAVFRIPAPHDTVPMPEKGALHLMLDGVQDPGNMGTIVRTADWFGFDRIYASKDTVDIFNPKTVQSTMGSLKRVEVIYCDLPTVIQESGIDNIYGTLLDGRDMFHSDLSDSGIIIMGNEGKGLSKEVRALVNRPLLIPPFRKESHGESLNVAVATAITLATFRNQ